MKIKSIDITPIHIPLKQPFVTAIRKVSSVEALRIALLTDEGSIGYGEAPATAMLTGETIKSIEEAVRSYIGPSIIGHEAEEDLAPLIKKPIYGNTSAKAAVEMAWLDLQAQKKNLPLYKMLAAGGSGAAGKSDALENDLTISVGTVETMIADAQSAIKDGFTILKIKTGAHPETDAQQLIELWNGIKDYDGRGGGGVSLRIDANQGWTARQAIGIIRTWEDAGLPIDIIEQPVPAWDIEGLAEVQAHTEHIIAADESVFSPHDALRCIRQRAAKVINIKLIKAGGIRTGLEIAKLCGEHGLECMVGCTIEGQISSAAAAHLAASTPVITRVDIDCPLLRVPGGYAATGPEFNGPVIKMSDAPGIGTRPLQG